MLTDRIRLAPEVAEALADGRPVVALESTLISHGLPYPQNLEVARASESAVRESGAVPATVAIHGGRLLVGLEAAALETLATAPAGSVMKAARPSLAEALVGGGWAATTVSATMMAAHAAGVAVFATGGVGGVHRGAYGGPSTGGAPTRPTLDVSSDLEELGRTPVAVVCAGPKAILDLPLTLEFLETRGVPVVAIGQDDIPGFYARHSRVPAPASVPDLDAAGALIRAHLDLGERAGLLLCVPVPASAALETDIVTEVVEQAVGEAETALVRGPELTPWLLARIAELTGGASVRANTALIVNDARVAGQLALALAVAPPAREDPSGALE